MIEDVMKEASAKAVEFLQRRFDNYTLEEKRDIAIVYMCGYFDAKMENGQGRKVEQIGENART